MPQAPALPEPIETELQRPELRLLVATESRWSIFRRNLRDLFHRTDASPLHLKSSPGIFWSDVFVDHKLPWRRFLQSSAVHLLAMAILWTGSRLINFQPQVTAQTAFKKSDVIYYSSSEYLPPLDTRSRTSAPVRHSDSEYSAQTVISVPPEADNRSQTIVTAPKIQLRHDVPLPNIVAWSGKPELPIAPAPAVPVSEIMRLAPRMENNVIAPPPVVRDNVVDNLRDSAGANSRQALATAVIAPPPAVDDASKRRMGELNIGDSSVIAPAPQLTLDPQRSSPGRSTAGLSGQAQVVAPPPSLGATGHARSSASVVALSLHPAVGAPPAPPEGNRRGSFAAGPEGRRGASGIAGASTGSGKSDSSGSGKKNSSDLPSGLYVGPAANAAATVAGDPVPKNTVNPNLLAGVRPTRISPLGLQAESASKLSTEERTVFGNRKFYSLSLNMPNLNSAAGSWIIRFAALKPDSVTSPAARAAAAGDPSSALLSDLSAPVAMRKVDPAYPLELMKQNVSGTVILYAVIRADGTVGGVRVLRSVDERLDQFASDAIAKWQFQPATKNGDPVDVEATFWIPFRPVRAGSNF